MSKNSQGDAILNSEALEQNVDVERVLGEQTSALEVKDEDQIEFDGYGFVSPDDALGEVAQNQSATVGGDEFFCERCFSVLSKASLSPNGPEGKTYCRDCAK